MKPVGPIARRGDYELRDVPLHEAAALISAHHYARGCSNTAVYLHGLYRAGEFVGVALWLPPTPACARSVSKAIERIWSRRVAWKRILSLSRLVIAPGEPTNAASILIGASIRKIQEARVWGGLVTFADESQNHRGTIYRATNWHYVGRTKPEPRWVDSGGRQVARKRAGRTRTVHEMQATGFQMVGRFAKHKFIRVLA